MSRLKNTIDTLWQPQLRWPLMILLMGAFTIGYISNRSDLPVTNDATHAQHTGMAADAAEVWTCSMHPQIRKPGPGACPICGMDLIPVGSGAVESGGPRELKLSANAVKLAEIQTAPVERRYVANEIRMVGKIEYDETRLKYISAYVPGRIDRLFVDYTGTMVRQGDHLVDLYSPDLISAQEELRQSRQMLQQLDGGASPAIRESISGTLAAAREKLRLLGMTPRQVEDIENSGTSSDHLTIYSPISGVVIHRNATEGMYVQTGSRIYTLADLSRLWIKLDAYESDLQWLRYGQVVEFRTEAYPGEVFNGKIAFIDPVLDARTRTVKVRVNVRNDAGKLKPEMFVRAVVHSRTTAGGRVMDPALAGKWISPMHPEIVKDHSGNCDICGMKLVRAEDLGYVSARASATRAPLVIPATAPLITGRRAVVYVAMGEGRFQGREVVLGARSGDFYLVTAGLQEGEKVVTNGNFKIDSDLQIRAQPSMMSPEGGGTPGHQHGSGVGIPSSDLAANPAGGSAPPHSQGGGDGIPSSDLAGENITAINVPGAFRQSIARLFDAYVAVQTSLSGDDLAAGQQAARQFASRLADVDMTLLKGDAHKKWMALQGDLATYSTALVTAADIAAARASFEPLSIALYRTVKRFGTGGKQAIYRVHCPMAFDNRGADWLQNHADVKNPYFGAAMLSCGETVETVVSATQDGHEGHDHE